MEGFHIPVHSSRQLTSIITSLQILTQSHIRSFGATQIIEVYVTVLKTPPQFHLGVAVQRTVASHVNTAAPRL